MNIKIDEEIIHTIFDMLESVDNLSYTNCDHMNKPQLISALMARQRIIDDVWEVLDNATAGQLK